ncbi:hypothetical protein ACFE04_024987 [Oxalis oulophora]
MPPKSTSPAPSEMNIGNELTLQSKYNVVLHLLLLRTWNLFYGTSAKNATNVEEAFMRIMTMTAAIKNRASTSNGALTYSCPLNSSRESHLEEAIAHFCRRQP